MNKIVFFINMCICLYFIVYVLLRGERWICLSNSRGKIETLTWIWRRIPGYCKTGRSTGIILSRIISIKRGWFMN